MAAPTSGHVRGALATASTAFVALVGVVITKVRGSESGLRASYRGFYVSALLGAGLAAIAALRIAVGMWNETGRATPISTVIGDNFDQLATGFDVGTARSAVPS